MPKPSAIITTVAALMNDSAQTQYTNTTTLPYLNLALDILQEIFELNGLPVVEKTSEIITIPASSDLSVRLGFDTVPALPSNLIEIEQLWESQSGLNQWSPVIKRLFLPHYLQNGTRIQQFLIYAWKNQAIELIGALQDNDLKIDFTSSIFNTPILIANIDVNLAFTNIKTFLEFETAALCSVYIAENEERATILNTQAGQALERTLGISVKGMQSIVTRRKPFRQAFKLRNRTY